MNGRALTTLGTLLTPLAVIAIFAALFTTLLSESRFVSNITVIAASLIGITALSLLFFDNRSKKHSIKGAIKLANDLANGEAVRDTDGSELQQAVKSVSDYIAVNAALAREMAGGPGYSIQPRSETDMLGTALILLNESLNSSLGTREARDRLQKSIVTLLEEVSAVAGGDLTVRAEVGPEITGEIAAAFNKMTGSLHSLIRQVKDVTLQVAASASAINETTEQLAEGSVAQASQISRTTAAIAQMTQQIQEISRAASQSAKVAADALRSAQLGLNASDDNIRAMASIRSRVQETAKRIKKLGERAQEIGQITGLIDDLSDRTGLLALNASLKATANGGAGDGFGVVAEEVERLAERSNRLTMQISHLTQTINLETKEVVASMEETIQEVVTGSSLADKAGRSLTEIERIAEQLTDLLNTISSSAEFSARSSEDISNAMSGISEVTALVRSGTKRAASSVRTLVDLSRDLRAAVAPFKLPADPVKRTLNEEPARSSFVN